MQSLENKEQKYWIDTAVAILEVENDRLTKESEKLKIKAEAYDRLMSGTGKMSMQEWANFLGAPVTLDRDGKVEAHYSSPVRYSEEEGWWYNPHNQRFEIPRHLVDTHGCWPRLSITYPDGWEEKA